KLIQLYYSEDRSIDSTTVITLQCTNSIRIIFFFSSRRRHTRSTRDWSSDVCSSDLYCHDNEHRRHLEAAGRGSGPSAGDRVSTYAPFADLRERLARKRPPK